MKKEYKTYALLSVVLIVWGLIGFRLVKAINPSGEAQMNEVITEKFSPKTIAERETFDIIADYRDPFLGTIKSKETVVQKKISRPVKKDIPKKNITYTGFIIDQGSNDKLFFVTIDGQQHMVGIKNTVNGVTLIDGTKSFIKVSYFGISEKITLNK